MVGTGLVVMVDAVLASVSVDLVVALRHSNVIVIQIRLELL